MPLLIRPATSEDLPSIVGMLADDDLGRTREDARTPLDPRYLAAFAAIERDPNQQIVVAEQDGRVVGVLQLTLIPGLSRLGMLRGQIEGVRVASSERGGGVGRIMLEWAIGECRARGCGLVQLTTDKRRAAAHSFYEGLGFEATHEGMKRALD
ncbi:MAG TPA: GNAT family N-acetyltransferase [Kofleriaceae bacterium]|nr:GNAT family N-acetyltransferase [Kofleriaceae bacterium]